MKQVKIYSLQGTELKSVTLPKQFEEPVNSDLIKRAVFVVQQNKRQKYGAFEDAGTRSSATVSKRRRNYKTSYGHGISRVPRKVMWRRGMQFGWEGAFAPGMKGGRMAHPAKAEKNFTLKINKKERRKAIRSAMAATLYPDLVSRRHKLPKDYPLVLESKMENLEKTKQVQELLLRLGLQAELARISQKKIRAGKGASRARKYKIKKGPLFVVSKKCSLQKASRNLQGVDFSTVDKLNTEILAPGAIPGRLVLWSEAALEKLAKDKLFTDNPAYIKKEKSEEKK